MTIDQYMKLPYKIEVIPDVDDGGYGVCIPDLPGCLSTGETIEEAISNIEEAKREWITAAVEDGLTIPEPSPEVDLSSYSGNSNSVFPRASIDHSLNTQRKKVSA